RFIPYIGSPCRCGLRGSFVKVCFKVIEVRRSTHMKTNLLATTLASAVIGGLAMTPAFADDADTAAQSRPAGEAAASSDRADRSAGEVIDDAAIVAKVKSGLLSSSEVEGL